MNKKLERSNGDKILRRFTNMLKPLGFKRVKSTFWVREKEMLVEFVHIHKYSFSACFRVHTCVRPYNDSFEAIALSGPTESELQSRISFEYDETIESVNKCANKMFSFVQQDSEAWFSKWSNPISLLSSESPLSEAQKIEFKQALNGNTNAEWVELTKKLLKI